ncbi:unnamed protein product [Boreogadus saida]
MDIDNMEFSPYLPDFPLLDLRLPDYSSLAKPPPARLPSRYQTPACLTTRPSPSPCLHDCPPGTRPGTIKFLYPYPVSASLCPALGSQFPVP